MPNWLQKLTRRGETQESPPPATPASIAVEEPPPFSTKLAVDSPGAPGRAGAEALYQKWATKWQEY